MGTLDRPTEGGIFIENIPLSMLSNDRLAELRNRRIGLVFQPFNLLSHLTVVENVELSMVTLSIPTRRRGEGYRDT